MFGIGMTELMVILVIGLVVIGPKKLPGLARSLGRSLAEFRRASDDMRRDFLDVTQATQFETPSDAPPKTPSEAPAEAPPEGDKESKPDADTEVAEQPEGDAASDAPADTRKAADSG